MHHKAELQSTNPTDGEAAVTKCKTIALMETLKAEDGEMSSVASSCLGILEDLSESGMNASAIEYLHLLVDEIYKAGNLSLLDHLLASADCPPCQAMAARIQSFASGV